jgi:hypothetical protein
VVYQARLESVCSREVTVGSNPTLSAVILQRGPLAPVSGYDLSPDIFDKNNDIMLYFSQFHEAKCFKL